MMIQHYGLMQHIHSDRGNCFTSKIWGSLLKYASIKRALGTSMNPQGDGIAEANVGNIKGLIRPACERQPRHWGEAGKWAAWTYNRSFHSTIGTTPFFAVFGVFALHCFLMCVAGFFVDVLNRFGHGF